MSKIPEFVNSDQIKTARKVNLYGFLLARHPDAVQQEGDSLRLYRNHSVSVKTGYTGFMDFATQETGNPIDFLVNYLGYKFPDAVSALCAYKKMDGITHLQNPDVCHSPVHAPQNLPSLGMAQVAPAPKNANQAAARRTFSIPDPLDGPYHQLYTYLTQKRHFPPGMVQFLLDNGLLYQEVKFANMVFINRERTFYEMRGTNPYKPFHGVGFSDPAGFWWFMPQNPCSQATIAYVCESAIDAISLYLLHLRIYGAPLQENGMYCGICGVGNQHRIDRIKTIMAASGFQTVIAVDNDKAGEDCRQKNRDCPAIIPRSKDWNDDLAL